MIDPVAALRSKRAKILETAQREADALEAEARDLARLAALAEKHGFVLVEKASAQPRENGHDELPLVPEAPAYRAAINVAERVIRAAGVPLEFDHIYDACVQMNVPLAGVKPRSTLSAYLSHPKSTVESIRRGVYWLKGVEIPK